MLITVMLMMVSALSVHAQGSLELADSLVNNIGIDLFDEEIDDVIFQTNEFLTDATFIGGSGPFWWILECCMALGALFALILAGGMTYKMMTKGEPFDVLKILRVLGIAIVMAWWYPHGESGASVLGVLAYVPNCIGSYTHDLYEIEAAQVQQKFDALQEPLRKRQELSDSINAIAMAVKDGIQKGEISDITQYVGYQALQDSEKKENNDVLCSGSVQGRLVGHHLCSADPIGNADHLRPADVGIQYFAQVGECLGEMDYEVSDSAFLRCHALLRRFLCATSV